MWGSFQVGAEQRPLRGRRSGAGRIQRPRAATQPPRAAALRPRAAHAGCAPAAAALRALAPSPPDPPHTPTNQVHTFRGAGPARLPTPAARYSRPSPHKLTPPACPHQVYTFHKDGREAAYAAAASGGAEVLLTTYGQLRREAARFAALELHVRVGLGFAGLVGWFRRVWLLILSVRTRWLAPTPCRCRPGQPHALACAISCTAHVPSNTVVAYTSIYQSLPLLSVPQCRRSFSTRPTTCPTQTRRSARRRGASGRCCASACLVRRAAQAGRARAAWAAVARRACWGCWWVLAGSGSARASVVCEALPRVARPGMQT